MLRMRSSIKHQTSAPDGEGCATHSSACSSFQRDKRDLPADLRLVLGEKWVGCHDAIPQPLTLRPFQHLSAGVECLGPDLDGHFRVRQQITIPIWVGWRAGIRCDHKQALAIGHIHHRCRAALTGLGADGAKTGQRRTTPMMYVSDGERLLVIASNAGAPAHPDWYRNLLAHPEVTVEVGAETFDARAEVLEGAERQRLWDSIVASYPFFTEHQAKISREIPLVALERRAG